MSRYTRWFACCVAALWVFAAPALSQKVTIDPNTTKTAQDSEEQSDKSDIRLAQKVTYEARRKTVSAIMDELSEQTGITLKAGQNNQDWQVRDRRMNVFAKDIPLATLMNSIARVMKFKWSREGKEGAYSYRVYMDRRTLLDAESRLQREEERIKQQQAEKRMRTFEKLAEAASMSPEQLEKIKDESPFAYLAAKSGISDSLGSFFSQVPAAADALASGQEMSMNAGALSPVAQQNLVRAMRNLNSLEGKIGGNVRDFPEDIVDNMGAVTISINSHLEEMSVRPEMSFMLGTIEFQGGGRHFGIPLIDPDSSIAKLIGRVVLKSLEDGVPISEAGKELQSEFTKAFISDFKQIDLGEKAPEHPDEPALHEKVKLQPKSPHLEDVESALAEASKLAVISDYFGRGGMMPMGGGQEEAELKIVLDKIGDSYRYNWEKRGDVIELRSKDWYRKRATQIPEAWLESWRKTLKDTGTLDIGDLAQIAMLDLEQFTSNISEDTLLTACGLPGVVFPNRELLRLYAGLNQSQQAMLFTDGGLDLRTLAPEQWKQAEKLIRARNSAFLQSPEAVVTVAGRRTAKGKRFEYRFTVTSTDASAPLELTFTTPEYREPPEEQPKPAEKPKSDPQRSQTDMPRSR